MPSWRLPAQAGNWYTMYYNYVIISTHKNWFYVGFTQDLGHRLLQHNSGKVKSTKSYKPYDLIFVQISINRVIARDVEKYLKIRWNKESLIKLVYSC